MNLIMSHNSVISQWVLWVTSVTCSEFFFWKSKSSETWHSLWFFMKLGAKNVRNFSAENFRKKIPEVTLFFGNFPEKFRRKFPDTTLIPNNVYGASCCCIKVICSLCSAVVSFSVTTHVCFVQIWVQSQNVFILHRPISCCCFGPRETVAVHDTIFFREFDCWFKTK